jgi:hypothetical protein
MVLRVIPEPQVFREQPARQALEPLVILAQPALLVFKEILVKSVVQEPLVQASLESQEPQVLRVSSACREFRVCEGSLARLEMLAQQAPPAQQA